MSSELIIRVRHDHDADKVGVEDQYYFCLNKKKTRQNRLGLHRNATLNVNGFWTKEASPSLVARLK